MKFEEILNQIGGWGTYQKALFCALSLVSFPNAFHGLVQTFAGYSPSFMCTSSIQSDLPEYNSTNEAFEQYLNQCEYEVNGTTKACTKFMFDTSQFKETVVTQWDLVCDKKYLTELDTSSFMAGKLIGAFVLGLISDVIGRRKVFFSSILLLIVSGVLAYFAPWYSLYLIARLMAGIANSGTTLAGYILALELVDPEHRPIPGIIWHVVNAIGNFFLLAFAYYIREWYNLMLAITIPSVFFLFYWKYLPESPRWLLLQGRHKEAREIIEQAARVNGVLDMKISFDKEAEQVTVKPSLIQEFHLLLKSWYLFRSTLIIWGCWMCLSGAYYGLSLNAKHMSGNIYLNYMYISLVEIPAILILIPLAKLMSRRHLLGALMLCGGVSCLLILVLPDYANIIAFTGKFFVSGAYAFSYLISVELFPTSIRNLGLGVSSVMARVGGILCPFVLITKDYWEPLPYVIFGGSTLLIGISTMFLRETESSLLETTADSEHHGKRSLAVEEAEHLFE